MNQRERIKHYMSQFGSISTIEAFKDLGITRLGARILEIERQGIQIIRKTEYSQNRFGQKVHYTLLLNERLGLKGMIF